MKEKRLLKAMGKVDEKYIEEASPAQHAKRPGWLKRLLSIYRSGSLSFLTGKDGASSCGKGVSGAPFHGYPAGDHRPYEGCFPGIEGERETASWERNF